MPVALHSELRASVALAPDREIRRHIDRCVSRALVDSEYARRLLNDPTVAVEKHGCPPQQYRTLRGIRADDLVDFARQAYALFWRVEPNAADLQDELPLAVGATR